MIPTKAKLSTEKKMDLAKRHGHLVNGKEQYTLVTGKMMKDMAKANLFGKMAQYMKAIT